MISGLVDISIIALLQGLTIPIGIASRVPQIRLNYQEKSTGNLSFLTFFLNFAGAVARVFTTLQELDEPLFLVGYLSSTILNGTILCQIIYYNYGQGEQKKLKEQKEQKEAQQKKVK